MTFYQVSQLILLSLLLLVLPHHAMRDDRCLNLTVGGVVQWSNTKVLLTNFNFNFVFDFEGRSYVYSNRTSYHTRNYGLTPFKEKLIILKRET